MIRKDIIAPHLGHRGLLIRSTYIAYPPLSRNDCSTFIACRGARTNGTALCKSYVWKVTDVCAVITIRVMRIRGSNRRASLIAPPDATSDQAGVPLLDEDYLILSTIHSANGQEWKSVFLLNAVDGCLPCDLGTGTSAEIEEERRLLYVAMTRAKDDLHLIVPQRFFTHGQSAQGDRHVYASRTRFIPDGLLGLFDRTSWPPVGVGAPARVASGVRINVGARMRGMWR